MPPLGAHMSIAGGYHRAVEAAAELGMDCVQIFTKNNNQWTGKPLTDSDIAEFRATLDRTGVTLPCSHDSYLINLASPDPALWQKSLEAFIIELERAEALGCIGVVMHPGSHVSSTADEGLAKIIEALNQAHRATRGVKVQTWLETTAGQGTNLGWRFEELQHILGGLQEPERTGVCVDTCHIFAAGYELETPETYAATFDEFDRRIGLNRIRAFHLNDSVKGLGSRVDRHARIGGGQLGLEPFRLLLNDPRFTTIPMYLETPKGEEEGEQLDAINLRTLRALIGPTTTAPKRKRRTST
ncbi:MAG TPA: deoxyribonuclease IV [Planctomycetaceae bacterium]|nr:deoxyribonuclease IV [Planctomycetaceae bacterium]